MDVDSHSSAQDFTDNQRASDTTSAGVVAVSQAMIRQSDLDLNQRSIAGVLTYALGWLLVVLTTQISLYQPVFVYSVGVLLFVVGFLRLYLVKNFDTLYHQNPHTWRSMFALGMILSALFWSLFTAWGLLQLGLNEQGMIVLLPLLLICAGGIFSLAPKKLFLKIFINTLLWPQIIVLVYMATGSAYVIALMLFLFSLFMMVFSKNVHQNYMQLLHKNDLLEQNADSLLRAKEAAEAASQAKSSFLAVMSHELRTPMNSILGATELLDLSSINSEQKKYVTLIHRSGTALLSLLNDLLDFSKIEAGKMELEQSAFQLRDMTGHLYHLLNIRASEKGLTLTVTVQDGVAKYLIGDETRLQQILLNLLGNAIKFSAEGEVSLVVSVVGKAQRLRFEVRDQGIGIAQDKQAQLFQSFQQVESSTTRKYGGTGLGLAISKQLVDLMQGEMGVQSEEGQGACFWFEIPYKVATEISQHQAGRNTDSFEKPILATHKLLLAEDIRANQIIAVGLLKKLGLTDVTVVDNGNKAVQALEKEDYDLVLMDLQMPECGGLEACRRIRGKTIDKNGWQVSVRNPQIPVIALSANALPADIEECLEAGMNGHIGKPFNKQELGNELKKWLKVG